MIQTKRVTDFTPSERQRSNERVVGLTKDWNGNKNDRSEDC